MYALINKQKMELVCRFEDLTLLSAEQNQPPFITTQLEEGCLVELFTLLELKLLYRGLGIVMGTSVSDKKELEKSIIKMIIARPQRSPAQQEIFPPYVPETGSSTAGTGTSPALASASTLAKPAGPRTGNKAIIWEVADAMWKDAGSPLDIPRVLLLRKEIMTKLETEHGIKKTTSSTALGGWQKDRLNK